MKTILLFTDWYLPGYRAGGPIQSCANLVDHLQESYQIYLVTSSCDYGISVPYTNVPIDEWVSLGSNVKVMYLSPSKQSVSFIQKICASISYDLVYLNSMFSLKFTVLPLLALRKQLKTKQVVLAPRGMLAEGALSIKAKKKKFFISLFKLLRVPSKISFHATSVDEGNDIRSVFAKATKIVISPNLPGNKTNGLSTVKRQDEKLKLVCISRLSPEKNVNFILDILKDAKYNLGTLLHVYGSLKNNAYTNDFNIAASRLPDHIQTELKGELSNQEVKEKLSAYHFFILPTLGENFGHAIYEAMSAGLPVIISDKTPWRNLEENKAGWDLSLEDKEAWVKVIDKVAQMDQQEYSEWSKGARSFAEKAIDVEKIKEQYKEMFG